MNVAIRAQNPQKFIGLRAASQFADWAFPTMNKRLARHRRGGAVQHFGDNVIEFPLRKRHEHRGCPQCGRRGGVWQIGRLLWGYCDAHQLRWVVADLRSVKVESLDRDRIRRGLEYLSSYIEVSR